MDVFWEYLTELFCAEASCALIGQILIDKTKLTPARILVVIYVVSGVVLGGAWGYTSMQPNGEEPAPPCPSLDLATPLAKGVSRRRLRRNRRLLGALTGGITATAGGITAAIFLGLLVALLFKPKPKR